MTTTTRKSAKELATALFVNMMRNKTQIYKSYAISTKHTGLPAFMAYVSIEEWKGGKRYFLNCITDSMPVKDGISNLRNEDLQACFRLVNAINEELAYNFNF